MRYLAAFSVSLVLALLLGPVLIPFLGRLKLGQRIRADGPKAHLAKAGTPTMGGVIFLAAVTASVLAVLGPAAGLGEGGWRPVAQDALPPLVALAVTLGFAGIGFIDDLLKVVFSRSLGMRARDKLFGQILLGLLLGLAAERWAGLGTSVRVPFTAIMIDLGPLYMPFVAFIGVAESNAVNLTDGLDGLAAGSCAISFGVYAVVSALGGNDGMAVFSLAVMGSLIGFLKYNTHPAQVFMGDTGSMGLGAALASVAVLSKTEMSLPLIGGLYVLETVSVVLQVAWFRLTGKRIFRMSPLHHHFELKGWPEEIVVGRFWLVSLFFGVVGLVGLLVTGF
ncbi:MAG: phospho-N-acetylmuramoyl-pentapeptide-transferase [Firmicutes bacterium]|nr:phospho-N-acetylmuramoyl-pentapeptide-transferase [Bacillota bacterium]